MAITGSGTQADPWIVHSYDEFMSLKDRESDPASDTYYIQFFDSPNQTIDCNTYGSEFKWHTFDSFGNKFKAYHINLNGCTIKNFLIADGEVMFPGGYAQYRYSRTFYISNGAFRNVFLGSATSKFCTNQVNFQDVSISFNFAGTTVTPFDGDGDVTFDNCAMYLVGSTLQAPVIKRATLTDTDIEIYIANQNDIVPFCGTSYSNYSTLQDCRIQGKIGGNAHNAPNAACGTVLGVPSASNNDESMVCKYINCVVDLDLTDSYFSARGYGSAYKIIAASGSTDMNTNVICDSHYPSAGEAQGLVYPTDWNYMSHENIRNGTYLNNAGFTVVEVVGS